MTSRRLADIAESIDANAPPCADCGERSGDVRADAYDDELCEACERRRQTEDENRSRERDYSMMTRLERR